MTPLPIPLASLTNPPRTRRQSSGAQSPSPAPAAFPPHAHHHPQHRQPSPPSSPSSSSPSGRAPGRALLCLLQYLLISEIQSMSYMRCLHATVLLVVAPGPILVPAKIHLITTNYYVTVHYSLRSLDYVPF